MAILSISKTKFVKIYQVLHNIKESVCDDKSQSTLALIMTKKS